MTNHPVIKLGRIAIRKYPMAWLDDVQRAERLAMERDLRTAPTPISGGMRKALHKELGAQNVLRAKRLRQADTRLNGHFLIHCKHCSHRMLYTEDDGSVAGDFKCDRCRRVF